MPVVSISRARRGAATLCAAVHSASALALHNRRSARDFVALEWWAHKNTVGAALVRFEPVWSHRTTSKQ